MVPHHQCNLPPIARDFSILFLAEVSTKTLSMISERLIGRRISPAGISSVNTDLNKAVEAWRRRDLSQESVEYLFIDGVHFHMHVGRNIEIVPVLVAQLKEKGNQSENSALYCSETRI